jgi:hypothetical protein
MKRRAGAPDGIPRAWATTAFFACLVLFTLTTYGGIRSPDNEVVFRAAQSFADRLHLDVEGSLDDWDGFGVARGRDGAQYPIFGPVQSIALAPFVLVGRAIVAGWSGDPALPPSLYVGGGLFTALYGTPLRDRPAHALRLVCASFNVVVGALCVVVFFLVLGRLTGSRLGALIGATFFAAGSLLWPYTGTYFSEPLAMLFVLLSFHWLAGLLTAGNEAAPPSPLSAGRAGLALGLGVATHLSAALFIPFFAAIPWLTRHRRDRAGALRLGLGYLAGVSVVLALLGVYNWSRFGNPFETGRTAVPGAADLFGYGVFTAPWPGIYGLLLGPGKGLFLFSPAVILGLISWPALHRRFPVLSWTLGGAFVARWLFIATRSDWHGGFSLGPRYMLMIVPFLLLPIGVAIDERIQRGDRGFIPWLAAALILCVAQQAAFCTGEIFTFLHTAKHQAERAGIDVFAGDRLYLDWQWSPLFRLLNGRRGPFLLTGVGLGNLQLWSILSATLAAPVVAGAVALLRRSRLGVMSDSTPSRARP